MMGYLTSGNPIVDAMGTMNITGNIIPAIWYRTVQKESGKPYLLAIAILADIVYWYRPTEVRDLNTGQITGWKKRFSEDILRQSYQYYADLFGESKKTIKTAIDRLEELDVVKRDFRTVAYGDGLISNNVMYIELIPSRVYELTYPSDDPCMDKKKKTCTEGAGDKTGGSLPTKPDTPMEILGGRGIPNGIQVPTNSDTGPAQNVHTLPPKREIPPSHLGETNSENTTEISDKDYINPINRLVMNDMIEQIKENIEYDHHMAQYDHYDRRLYDELFELICEVVCVRHETIRISGEDYPYALVRKRFLKLDGSHLEYVMGCMKETTTRISNVKAYMLTALYNAPSTIQHYFQQEVNHDMYGGGWEEKGIRQGTCGQCDHK